MLHVLLYGALAIVLGGLLFVIAARFLPAGEQIAPPVRDEPPWELPTDRAMRPEEVDAVRLPVALRGYRFAETDILLDRLADELRARDDEIARLRDGVRTAPEDGVVGHRAARVAAAHPDERLEEELAVAEAIGDAPATKRPGDPPEAADGAAPSTAESGPPPAEPAQGEPAPHEPAQGEPAQDQHAGDEVLSGRMWHRKRRRK